jgi:hypothetical protein
MITLTFRPLYLGGGVVASPFCIFFLLLVILFFTFVLTLGFARVISLFLLCPITGNLMLFRNSLTSRRFLEFSISKVCILLLNAVVFAVIMVRNYGSSNTDL